MNQSVRQNFYGVHTIAQHGLFPFPVHKERLPFCFNSVFRSLFSFSIFLYFCFKNKKWNFRFNRSLKYGFRLETEKVGPMVRICKPGMAPISTKIYIYDRESPEAIY